jgi:hypothetical protein
MNLGSFGSTSNGAKSRSVPKDAAHSEHGKCAHAAAMRRLVAARARENLAAL